jgi:dienelactone hydrolase
MYKMFSDKLSYSDEETTFQGYLAYDSSTSNKRPGILIVHDAWGCGEVVQQKANLLAKLGYVAFAVDMYGEGKTAKDFPEAVELVAPLVKNRPLIRKRILTAMQKITEHPLVDTNKIGAIGFCFGGMTVLDLARTGANIRGAVSFHGLLNPPPDYTSQTIRAKVLVLHGYDDPSVSPDQVNTFAKEMTAAGVDWQIHMYGHTVHAFTNPKANDPAGGRLYNATADYRSCQAMIQFFTEIFV